jgi:hypothetical protein
MPRAKAGTSPPSTSTSATTSPTTVELPSFDGITVPADLPAEQRDRLADIAERTPVTLAIRAGTPVTTTFASRTAST